MKTHRIIHWYRGNDQPVPEAYKLNRNKEEWYVDIEDIHEFTKQHGPIQLIAPNSPPYNCSHWLIWITDKSGRFSMQ